MRYDLKSFCYYGTKECLLDISKNIKNRKWKKKKATRMTQPPAAAFQHQHRNINAPLDTTTY